MAHMSMNDLLKYPEWNLKAAVQQEMESGVQVLEFVFQPDKGKEKRKGGKTETVVNPDFPFFKASPGEIVMAKGSWYIGLGKAADHDTDVLGAAFLKAFSQAARHFEKFQILLPAGIEDHHEIDVLTNLIGTALAMAVYPVDLLKATPSVRKIRLKNVLLIREKKSLNQWRHHLQKYLIMGRHANASRQVQSLPGNYLTPQTMEKRAQLMAKAWKLKLKIFRKPELVKMGAGGILAVSQGSARDPRMIILEYNPPGAKGKTLAFVGKGVTFDTGGISLKPGADMHEMKYDMCGSAAALHAVAAIAEMKLKVRVVAVVGMVENMPDGAAFKPGDVYTSLKGHTIEVQNTDAEGRLILGDLLHYTEKHYKPDLMVDLATLTGAILISLAQYYAGLFTTDARVREIIEKAAAESLEPVWAMPVSSKHKDMLKSNIADYNNIGGRYGGSSSAAAFLWLFVDHPEKWAHLDIAGIAFVKQGFGVYPAVATGYGIRLLCRLAENFR